MLRDLRVKIASSVKPLNTPDDLVWKRWLKPPACSSETFIFEIPGLLNKSSFEEWLEPALTEACKFQLKRVAVLQRKVFDKYLLVQSTKQKNFLILQPKSHRLFFALAQTKVSEKLFLQNEKPALVFPVFNSRNHVVLTSVKEIPLRENTTSTIAFDLSIDSLIVVGNLLPEEKPTALPNGVHWEFESVDNNFFSSMLSSAERSLGLLSIPASSKNLLSTAGDIIFIDENILSDYFFPTTAVSEELVSIPPATYNISLLDNSNLTSSVYKLKNPYIESSETHSYPADKFDLSDNVKVLKPASRGFKIKTNGFQGFRVSSPEAGSISKNLLDPAFTNYLDPVENSDKPWDKQKEINLPYLGKDTISRFNKVKIISEDPDLLPALAAPQKYEANFVSEHSHGLFDFQNNGVNLLINNPFALLSDESGLGKTLQAVTALQHLYKKRKIKSTLIISSFPDFGRPGAESPEGWLGHFNTWAPELKITPLSYDKETRKKQWASKTQVFLTTCECLLSDEAEEIIDHNTLKKFDCIILDNYQSFRLTSYQRDRIFQKLKLRYLWILDNSPIEEFENNIISYFINHTVEQSEKITVESITGFTKRQLYKSLGNDFPQRVSRNRWFELDDNQQRDYNVVLEQGQLKLYGSIERGNLFVIRPQIFTILHELMQTLNFSSTGNLSQKAEALISEVKRISEYKQKAVIFSQYEKYGLRRLEELFTENNINFVTYRAGMNNSAIEEVCRSFRNETNGCIFLADTKAVNKNLDLGSFNQIIHFDQWWNPISNWLAEDKVCSNNSNHILVQYYRTSGIIEEKIYKMLNSKGLLNKLVVESLSQTALADMISTEEWFDLFNLLVNKSEIPDSEPANFESLLVNYQNCTNEEFEKQVHNLLLRSGFKNLQPFIPCSSEDISTLKSIKVINSKNEKVLIRILCNHIVDENQIIEFLELLSIEKDYSKGLLFTNRDFSEQCRKYSAVKMNLLTLIDIKLFTQYLRYFKII